MRRMLSVKYIVPPSGAQPMPLEGDVRRTWLVAARGGQFHTGERCGTSDVIQPDSQLRMTFQAFKVLKERKFRFISHLRAQIKTSRPA